MRSVRTACKNSPKKISGGYPQHFINRKVHHQMGGKKFCPIGYKPCNMWPVYDRGRLCIIDDQKCYDNKQLWELNYPSSRKKTCDPRWGVMGGKKCRDPYQLQGVYDSRLPAAPQHKSPQKDRPAQSYTAPSRAPLFAEIESRRKSPQKDRPAQTYTAPSRAPLFAESESRRKSPQRGPTLQFSKKDQRTFKDTIANAMKKRRGKYHGAISRTMSHSGSDWSSESDGFSEGGCAFH